MAVAGYSTTLTTTQIQTVNKVWLLLLRDAGLISDANVQIELKRRAKFAFYHP
jgi:hypothetical protein